MLQVRGGAFGSFQIPIVCEIAIWNGKLVSVKHISRMTTYKDLMTSYEAIGHGYISTSYATLPRVA
jgi:hypothetical protein